jgi:hypothetical protein
MEAGLEVVEDAVEGVGMGGAELAMSGDGVGLDDDILLLLSSA